MSRVSTNEVVNGIIKNGFDYKAGVCIKNYRIVSAGNRERTEKYKGIDIRKLKRKEI